MKKKTVITLSVILAVLLIIPFIPFIRMDYDDGGTVEYKALAYTIVKWHKAVMILDENGKEDIDIYEKTSVYWFSDSLKSLSELYEEEMKNQK